MRIDRRSSRAGLTLTVALFTALAFPAPATAQTGDYFAGKTLRVIVGLEAGGTADVFIRTFAAQLRKHIPGNPTVVVQNMTGAGGSVAANYTYERAAPDGLTIVFNTFHPLAQALGDPSMRARYDQFDYVGAIGDIRVNYMRTDVVPGGAKKPADIMKAETVVVGALSHSDFSGTLGQLSLKVPGRKIQARRRLSRRRRYLPRDATRRGALPQHQHRNFPHPQRGLHQVRSGPRHQLSGAGRCQRQLRTQQARHRDAGLSRPLQGNSRQATDRHRLGGIQLAHQSGRRARLHCAGAAQELLPRRWTRCASDSNARPTIPRLSTTP